MYNVYYMILRLNITTQNSRPLRRYLRYLVLFGGALR